MNALQMTLQEFREEHGRGPHSAGEFVVWFAHGPSVRSANHMTAELESRRLTVRDGKIVPRKK